MSFEQLNLSNLLEVVELAERSDPYAWPEEQWRSSLRNDWVIAKREAGKLVGLLVLQASFFETELLYLLVAPEARRQGVAGKLLDKSLEESKELNAERMLLEVRVSNLAALALYTNKGFVREGRRKNYYPLLTEDQSTESREREDALLLTHWFIEKPD
ncbi:GNAT family N-acetyltransferase [Marinospirillum insulare]|uniref:Ribosomal-protein-alanine acetyltransferase n=1 Tax=Marinospirillum insulare TaxID=217169 RepID=A0ABQ5ZTL3_9GAMM|nr:GNAT family N-acetyltransferase [Marinospirillum insulare]GLR63501.1 ribosomal-protein-alanine acetyltransferase [Marinospirillum insulare]